MISDPLAVFFTLAVIVFLAVRLEARTRLFRALGAALTGILFGMALSNLGVLPGESPTYSFLMGDGVYFGIALILLSVDLRSVVQAGPGMMAAFAIGALGTAVGAITGGLLLAGRVGPETWKLSGQFTATYTGGGANFAAVGRAFDTSPDLFSAATAADVIITAVWMMVCLVAPVLLRRPGGRGDFEAVVPDPGRAQGGTLPAPAPVTGELSGSGGSPSLEKTLNDSIRPVSLTGAAALVVVAVGAVWGGGVLAHLLPSIPEVLWLTTLVLVMAQIPVIKGLPGAALFGNYLILLFLASNGARSVVANLVAMGPPVFYYAVVTVALHGLIIFGIGRLARLDLATLAVASQANVGGPASALALASARGYHDRLVPGVAVGLVGYALGNYLGMGVGIFMRGLLG